MSSTGAVTGNGVYSELEYKGRRFRVAQWYNDAMDAVSTAAFLRASRMALLMGGTDKAVAQREVAIARSFSLGAFEFDAIVQDEGMENTPELLATFLHMLLKPNDGTVTYELALDMVKNAKNDVIKAVSNANPQKLLREDKAGPTAGENAPVESVQLGEPSKTPGNSSGG